jgi:hypothetical protein
MSTVLAMCAIVQNEESYISEWIAFHILVGVRRFLIYDDGSDDMTADLARKYRPLAEIEMILKRSSGNSFDNTQRQAYQEGAQRLNGQTDFVAFIDVDEFLYATHEFANLPAALEVCFKDEVGAIAVQQRVFGSNGHRRRTLGSVIERFVRCDAPDDGERLWFKTVARPEAIKTFSSVHSVILKKGLYVHADGSPLRRNATHPGVAASFRDGPIRLNHYMLKSLDEYRSKQRRWTHRYPEMRKRYNGKYFWDRDATCNEIIDLTLASRSLRLKALMKR